MKFLRSRWLLFSIGAVDFILSQTRARAQEARDMVTNSPRGSLAAD
jgi:hypothetical protein